MLTGSRNSSWHELLTCQLEPAGLEQRRISSANLHQTSSGKPFSFRIPIGPVDISDWKIPTFAIKSYRRIGPLSSRSNIMWYRPTGLPSYTNENARSGDYCNCNCTSLKSHLICTDDPVFRSAEYTCVLLHKWVTFFTCRHIFSSAEFWQSQLSL
jgi:hypothetical protein